MGFSTDAIHAGQIPDPTTGAVITPIYQTTTYAQEELGKDKGFHYGRTQNFTRAALESNIASLEKAKYGIAFSSGLAAEHALLNIAKAGDHVIVSKNIYGGTYRLFEQIIKHYGIEFSWVNTETPENIEAAIKENTKLLFIETPANPMLSITDIRKASDICHKFNILSAVDNTFMSPYFQNPLVLGADIALHSSTKYINGHSDVIGGIILTNDEMVHDKMRFIQNSIGAVPSPFDCWLTLRSTKTLAVRMERHEKNALSLARNLLENNVFPIVIYPGLENHPQHDLAKIQMKGFGGMLTIDTGDINLTKRILKKVRIFTLAESLGGVESLICHPSTMTHASVPPEEKIKAGITESLLRLSVGIEDSEDLIADLENAVKP